MRLHYKIKNKFKNLPFYSEETNHIKKNSKKFTNAKFLSELPFLPKKTTKSKKSSNHQLSKELPFSPKKTQKTK